MIGIIIGASIVLYAMGAVFFLFMAAAGGAPLFGIVLGLFWPILVPYFWLRSKIDNRKWRKE